jgi:hypothetical protein
VVLLRMAEIRSSLAVTFVVRATVGGVTDGEGAQRFALSPTVLPAEAAAVVSLVSSPLGGGRDRLRYARLTATGSSTMGATAASRRQR